MPRRQHAAQATTIAPRWQTLWHQHGPFGGTLARIFGSRIWRERQTPLKTTEAGVHCARCGLDMCTVSATVPECAILAVSSLGVTLWIGQSAASEVQNRAFSWKIWLAIAGRMVLFWSWLPRCRRWTAPVHREMQRKISKMLGISVLEGYQLEALEGVCLNKCDTLVCVLTGSRNPCVLKESAPWPTMSLAESEQPSMASVVGQIHIGLKSAPWWHYGMIRWAPTHWRCGSNLTTSFGVWGWRWREE